MYDGRDNREGCEEEGGRRQDGKQEREGNRIGVRGTFNVMRL